MSYLFSVKCMYTGKEISVIRKSDNACIPFDEGNRDYQEQLAWKAEGNEPEAAD